MRARLVKKRYTKVNKGKLYAALAFSGALPFVACAILPLFGIVALPLFGRLDVLASTYGLAILCFLAGAHWATFLYRETETPLNLFLSSNAVFLFVWFAFVMTGLTWVLVSQVLAFGVLLWIDHRLLKAGLIADHYFRVRSVATVLACVSLLIILVNK